MELYLPPAFTVKQKKVSRFGDDKKYRLTPRRRESALRALEIGRRVRWEKHRGEPSHNAVPVCVYNLDGSFVGAYTSETVAAEQHGLNRKSVRLCVKGKMAQVGGLMVKKAQVEDFFGKKLVKKTPIEPYTGPMPHAKMVLKIKDGHVVEEFKSVKEAARSVNRTASAVSIAISKGTAKCGGFNWALKNK